MANGRGGSRIGGFFRGILTGLVVCAIAAVALSLSAPPPERGPIEGEPVVPGGTDAGEPGPTSAEPQAAAPQTVAPQAATPPAAETEPADSATPPATAAAPQEGTDEAAEPADEDVLVPQATSPGPEAGEAEPAGDGDAFTAPQAPTQ